MVYANLFFVKILIAAAVIFAIGCFIAYKYRNQPNEDGGGSLFITFGIVIAVIACVFMVCGARLLLQADYYNGLALQKEAMIECFKNAENEAEKNAYANELERIDKKMKHEEKYMTYKYWIAIDADKKGGK